MPADGSRAAKISGGVETNYLRDTDGSLLATYVNGSYANVPEEMWIAGRHFGTFIATKNGGVTSQTESFSLTNWLGSEAVRTDPATGSLSLHSSASLSATIRPLSFQRFPMTITHFTGKERDTESGDDYFGARYYSSAMGRFMSPDWADFPDAVPWANTDNPQSLNLYSYVQNNPLSNVDDDGHDCVVQSRTSNTTETVTTSAGNCDNVSVGDGQTKTYVPGTVTGISVNGGNSIDIAYNSYDGQSSGVTNAGGAPIPDNPGLAYNWGNNAQGYATLGAASKAVNYATIVVAVTFGAVGGAMVAGDLLAGEGLTTLAGENGFDLMGNRALNRAIGDAQRKILDDLFLGKGGPEGLTPRTIKILIEVAKRAIAAGKDSLGVQAARLNLLQNLLK